MLTQILPHRPADGRCLASARNLRTHAELLRDGAEAPVLTTGQRHHAAARRRSRRAPSQSADAGAAGTMAWPQRQRPDTAGH